jgi:hypothetical protein
LTTFGEVMKASNMAAELRHRGAVVAHGTGPRVDSMDGERRRRRRSAISWSAPPFDRMERTHLDFLVRAAEADASSRPARR